LRGKLARILQYVSHVFKLRASLNMVRVDARRRRAIAAMADYHAIRNLATAKLIHKAVNQYVSPMQIQARVPHGAETAIPHPMSVKVHGDEVSEPIHQIVHKEFVRHTQASCHEIPWLVDVLPNSTQ
jgi:hypothetical protein